MGQKEIALVSYLNCKSSFWNGGIFQCTLAAWLRQVLLRFDWRTKGRYATSSRIVPIFWKWILSRCVHWILSDSQHWPSRSTTFSSKSMLGISIKFQVKGHTFPKFCFVYEPTTVYKAKRLGIFVSTSTRRSLLGLAVLNQEDIVWERQQLVAYFCTM